jgi:hypothetical protein
VILASAAGSVRPFDGSRNTWSTKPSPIGHDGKAPEVYGQIGWWDGVWSAILYAALIVTALVLLRVVYLVITAEAWTRKPKAVDRQQHPLERLAEAVESGLAEIHRGTPANAVIACWVALEQAAAAAGVARHASETASEFTIRVLAVDGVSADDLLSLADLYREARYSSHPSTEATRDQARAALTRLRDDLAVTTSARSWRPWR